MAHTLLHVGPAISEEEKARQQFENNKAWQGISDKVTGILGDIFAPNTSNEPLAHELVSQMEQQDRRAKGLIPPHIPVPKDSTFSAGLLSDLRKTDEGPFSARLLQDLKGRGVGARHHAGMGVDSFVPKDSEEDEFGFLDAMFLSNLIAGTQGGPPPTPYGSAFGGGNRSFVGLPFA